MADHIEIAKENISTWEYRFQSFPGAPRPPARNFGDHGRSLKAGLSETIEEITAMRTAMGVDSDRLLVLELSGETMEPDVDLLQNKLRLSIVEEILNSDGSSRLVVQFDNQGDIGAFERERALYESGSTDTGLLTYRQRSDVFACIAGIRQVSVADRTGKKLATAIAEDSLPDGLFTVDIDVWYNGDITNKSIIEAKVRSSLGTGDSCLLGDLFVLPNLLLGRARVNRYTLEVLRKLDLIAMVDLPIGILSGEQCELYSADFIPQVNNELDDNAPLACIIDSGVFSGNPLLSSLIVGEEDFDLTEETPSDLNGHGTGVAGIVAYGDFHNHEMENHIYEPLVRICNGKVMHNEPMPSGGETSYPLDKRPEQLVEEAIRFFHKEYACRIFNLSSGDSDRVYNGGRQMAWASLLDELSRELDVVIVVSAGNVSPPALPDFASRDELMSKCRDQLLTDNHSLIDPATTALGITVGSITRYEEPESFPQRPTPLSAGKRDYPSVFTRTGEGVSGAIKPEFVDYGGNLAIMQPFGSGSGSRWHPNRTLNEPTLNNTPDKVFKGWQGTSFAAPHVTHVAARLEKALQSQIGEAPSANLIRAMLASSSKSYEGSWMEAANPPNFEGIQRQPQSWRMRLSGYGKVDDSTLFTDRNHVTLFTEDALDLRQIHLYKVPVPREFLALRTTKKIAIGFAYNPPTRLSRKSYIANSLWFEVFRRIDVEALLNYKGKKVNADENAAERIIEDFSKKHGASFSPGYTEVRDSTLQQRVWQTGKNGGAGLLWEDNDPFIYVLVTGKAKFKHPYEAEAQPYALSITFSFENEEDIQLRQKLVDKVTIKQREQVRTRTQIQI